MYAFCKLPSLITSFASQPVFVMCNTLFYSVHSGCLFLIHPMPISIDAANSAYPEAHPPHTFTASTIQPPH
jgi:hypothetical protein